MSLTRQCARPGCSQPATATLTYDYAGQAAWLERLVAEKHPMTHDLCEAHADGMSVPQGWRLEDRRIVADITSSTAPAAEPAAASAPTGVLFRSQLAS
ncbi:MAG: DUF3499 family protein [Acidimicrobiia bacterium]|nr:DUF3499 family protein [Acidimicrobiia bacterium]